MKNGRVIPPLSVVRLMRADARTPGWHAQVGREFRIGYYSRACGVECVWLVNEKGEYEQTADQAAIHDYFEVVELSRERSLFGKNRAPIPALRRAPGRLGKKRLRPAVHV